MSWKKKLQHRLNERGLQVGPADSVIGPRTLRGLLTFLGCRSESRAKDLADALAKGLEREGFLENSSRFTEAFGEWAHESGGFNHLVENHNYSSSAMRRAWPRRFPTVESTLPFVGNPRLLFNTVYANRMGNGPVESGDGWNFRGRGIIQTTGRDNYARVARRTNLPLLSRPDLLEFPENAVISAFVFWRDNNLHRLADEGNSDAISRRINGGSNGLEDRREKKKLINSLLI